MTSKEALNKMSNYIYKLGGGETTEEEDTILYDLEILEILLKSIYLQKYMGNEYFNIIIKDKNDFKKIKKIINERRI